ncbi:MAG: DUF2064 domain-containing protein [Actinomycetia bacterium]|nr:DUF2064 domain-containing protein [Actinomycetes bacterium]
MSDGGLFTVLVVAKAPVPGLAKTRLCPPLTYEAAADVAAASLLDTLHVASESVGLDRSRVVVSMTGDLSCAARRDDVMTALEGCHVVDQRGSSFGERLAGAHQDAGALGTGSPVVQIGMDTPHVTADLLSAAAAQLSGPTSAVIGEAVDGGWWLLALADPSAAAVLARVPMSRSDTARLTREALQSIDITVTDTSRLSDVDTWGDAVAVSAEYPNLGFAASVWVHQNATHQRIDR